MHVIRKKPWALPDSAATDESVFLNRRALVKAMGLGPILLAGGAGAAAAASGGLYPAKRNPLYKLDRPLTEEKDVVTYNNFFEFGSHKEISEAAQALKIRPWQVRIDGLVEKEMTIDFDDLPNSFQAFLDGKITGRIVVKISDD